MALYFNGGIKTVVYFNGTHSKTIYFNGTLVHSYSDHSNHSDYSDYSNYSNYSNSGGCIHKDTPVLMGNGEYKAAKDLVVGDILKAANIAGVIDSSDPQWINWRETNLTLLSETTTEIVRVRQEVWHQYWDINNGLLKITEAHPLLVKKGNEYLWLDVQDLVIGDSLVQLDGTLIPVTTVEHIEEDIDVVEYDCEDVDNYVVGNTPIIIHNIEIAK